MTEDSYEVDVPESAGPVIRVTPGGEQPIDLPVEDGTVTTDSAKVAHAVSEAMPDAGPVRMVPASRDQPTEVDFTDMVDEDFDEPSTEDDPHVVQPEDPQDQGEMILPEDRKDEPDQPAEPDTTTRSARRGR